MMKKQTIRILSLVLAMSLVLAGCGGSTTSAPASSAAPEASTAAPSEPAKTLDWPKKDITLVSPYAAGGSADMNTRPVAEELSRILDCNVVVLNQAGGGATIGTSYVATAKPDGYTFLMGSPGGLIVQPALAPVSYTLDNFDAIAQTSDSVFGIMVSKDFPADTFEEFVEWIEANPGELLYSGPGANSTQQMLMMKMASDNGWEVTNIPQDGAAPAIAALLGGHIHAYVGVATDLISYHESGEAKILAVINTERADFLPDVPCLTELGYDNPGLSALYCIMAPKGVDPEILAAFEDAVEQALASDYVQDAYAKMNVPVAFLGSEDISAKLAKFNETVIEVVNSTK